MYARASVRSSAKTSGVNCASAASSPRLHDCSKLVIRWDDVMATLFGAGVIVRVWMWSLPTETASDELWADPVFSTMACPFRPRVLASTGIGRACRPCCGLAVDSFGAIAFRRKTNKHVTCPLSPCVVACDCRRRLSGSRQRRRPRLTSRSCTSGASITRRSLTDERSRLIGAALASGRRSAWPCAR